MWIHSETRTSRDKNIQSGDKLYVKWKGYDNSFNSWIDKEDKVHISEYFSEPKSSGRTVKVELDLSNYVTKTDLKNATNVDTSDFAEKVDLGTLKSNNDKSEKVPSELNSLKSTVDELDNGKLKTTPVDLSKSSHIVKSNIVKKRCI